MLHRSIIETRGDTVFPAWQGERIYMRPFLKADGLPQDLSRWQPTVDAMLDGIDTDQPVYIMIDETEVEAGKTQRRPGLHIDGYWDPGITAYGSHRAIASGHRGTPGRHQPRPPREPSTPPRHRSIPPGHSSGSMLWKDADFAAPEGIILASSVSAAEGYLGIYEGPIGEMGDCAHIDISDMEVLQMESGRVYAGNVNCLHQSLPVEVDCRRSLVRLNVPGWTPKA